MSHKLFKDHNEEHSFIQLTLSIQFGFGIRHAQYKIHAALLPSTNRRKMRYHISSIQKALAQIYTEAHTNIQTYIHLDARTHGQNPIQSKIDSIQFPTVFTFKHFYFVHFIAYIN